MFFLAGLCLTACGFDFKSPTQLLRKSPAQSIFPNQLTVEAGSGILIFCDRIKDDDFRCGSATDQDVGNDQFRFEAFELEPSDFKPGGPTHMILTSSQTSGDEVHYEYQVSAGFVKANRLEFMSLVLSDSPEVTLTSRTSLITKSYALAQARYNKSASNLFSKDAFIIRPREPFDGELARLQASHEALRSRKIAKFPRK